MTHRERERVRERRSSPITLQVATCKLWRWLTVRVSGGWKLYLPVFFYPRLYPVLEWDEGEWRTVQRYKWGYCNFLSFCRSVRSPPVLSPTLTLDNTSNLMLIYLQALWSNIFITCSHSFPILFPLIYKFIPFTLPKPLAIWRVIGFPYRVAWLP